MHSTPWDVRTVNSRVSVVRIASSLELFHGDAVCLHRTFRTRLPDRHCRTRRGHRRQLQGRWLYLWEKYDSWRVRWPYTVFPPPRGSSPAQRSEEHTSDLQ